MKTSLKPAELAKFVVLSEMGFDTYDYQTKEKWHKLGRKVANEIGVRLFGKGNFDLRNNKAGPAVSGEVTLHSNSLYLQFEISCLGPNMGFMYRTCNGRKDYTGGMNRWMKFYELLWDFDRCCESFGHAALGD